MRVRFFPLDIDYRIVDGKARIDLYGRALDDGRRICVHDHNFEPYFFVLPKSNPTDLKDKLEKLRIEDEEQQVLVTKVEKVQRRFRGKEIQALKVTANLPKSVPKLREIISNWEMVEDLFEHDILFTRRYLMDKGITPMTLCEAEGEVVQTPNRIRTLDATRIEQYSTDTYRQPRMLAIDIETYSENRTIDPKTNPILMLALHGQDFRKVYVWKGFKTDMEDIEFVDSEAELIQKFKEAVEWYKPDILAGYYSDGFDLPYIKARADKYRIKLDISPDFSEPRIRKTMDTQVSLTGMVHLDVFKFIKKVMRGALETDGYGLNAVAYRLLGEEKHDVDLDALPEAWNTNTGLETFAKYNLHDAKLAYDLSEKMLPTLIELVKIVGLPPFDVNRMGYSQLVEWYLMRQAAHAGELIPNKPNSRLLAARKDQSIEGGFVFEPKPGLYSDIVVFDYLSLYPTIISSHNIDPGTLDCGCCSSFAKRTPSDQPHWFCERRRGFLANLIDDIITRRQRIKEMMHDTADERQKAFLDARQGALKLMANSFYGYLGFAPARWYSLECASATTAWGRYYIKDVIEKAKETGFKVLYSDTDSVFLALDGKSKVDAHAFAKEVNDTLPGLMELEFEGYYPSGLFVSAKMGNFGAKKKYALLDERGALKIKGFETIRRNWSVIAKEAQEDILGIVLREHDAEKALSHAKKVLKDLRAKKVPLEKLTIKTQLVKDLIDYAARGPHVVVAERMRQRGYPVGAGTMIEYVVTEGANSIGSRAKLPDEVKEGEYDPEYYIQNQVVPAVDRIFAVLGYRKDILLESPDQTSLAGFF